MVGTIVQIAATVVALRGRWRAVAARGERHGQPRGRSSRRCSPRASRQSCPLPGRAGAARTRASRRIQPRAADHQRRPAAPVPARQGAVRALGRPRVGRRVRARAYRVARSAWTVPALLPAAAARGRAHLHAAGDRDGVIACCAARRASCSRSRCRSRRASSRCRRRCSRRGSGPVTRTPRAAAGRSASCSRSRSSPASPPRSCARHRAAGLEAERILRDRRRRARAAQPAAHPAHGLLRAACSRS